MDHSKFYLAFFILCVSSILIRGDVPCPFGKELNCTCSGDCAATTVFQTASCHIPYGVALSFVTPPATYTITEQFHLTGYVWELKENAFVALRSIGELVLEQLPAGYVVNWHENAFQGVKISKLTSIGLNNAEKKAAALRNLGRNGLEGLRVVNSFGEGRLNLSGFEMREFRKLTSLSIEHTPIEYIDDNAFVGLEYNLEQLTLMSVELRTYPKKALDRLGNLRYLDLSENKMVFPHGLTTFENLSNLETLQLSGIDIHAAMQAGAMSVLPPKLLNFYLDRANLLELPFSIVQAAPSLQRLSLVDNFIHVLKPMSSSPVFGKFNFAALDELDNDTESRTTDLTERGNTVSIKTTTKQAVPQFKSQLTYLNLDSNPITQVIQGAMEPFPQVTELSMSGTHLVAFDFSALNGMTQLKTVWLNSSPSLRSLSATGPLTSSIVNIGAVSTALETIDPTLETLVSQPTFGHLDVTNSAYILCGKSVSWMAKYVLCDPRHITADGSKCADMQDKVLATYFAEAAPHVCDPPTTVPPPPPPPEPTTVAAPPPPPPT